MAGIYIHIPFCKKKCSYCDFYSIGLRENFGNFSDLIIKEIELRNNFLPDKSIETIYFGGGTPSLIPVKDISAIVEHIKCNFIVSPDPEITLEANPDDINEIKLSGYLDAGINRLSLGVQSFNDNELIFLGRRHNSLCALETIQLAQKEGFKNISIDLIYGLPASSLESWEQNLLFAFDQNIQHLSCYHLTYEEGTPLFRRLSENKFAEIDDTLSEKQFYLLRKLSLEHGFEHYEISNFAKEGFISRHNTSYWNGIPYLGVGPSAHSYNGNMRQWNPRSYEKWSKRIESGCIEIEGEALTTKMRFNEMILTRLRTSSGIDIQEITNQFGVELVQSLINNISIYISQGKMLLTNGKLTIHPDYLFISDGIISNLLIV